MLLDGWVSAFLETDLPLPEFGHEQSTAGLAVVFLIQCGLYFAFFIVQASNILPALALLFPMCHHGLESFG